MVYKVWIEVEEINEETDHYKDISAENLGFAAAAEFDTKGEAVDFACRLQEIARRWTR